MQNPLEQPLESINLIDLVDQPAWKTILIDLVKSGNTVAFSALGTKTAKAMGEVGVLTESDIARYVRSGRGL